jgi:hypothetical protein
MRDRTDPRSRQDRLRWDEPDQRKGKLSHDAGCNVQLTHLPWLALASHPGNATPQPWNIDHRADSRLCS